MKYSIEKKKTIKIFVKLEYCKIFQETWNNNHQEVIKINKTVFFPITIDNLS